jgi:hypothetical protein
MAYKNVRFYRISGTIPDFKSSYDGCLVLDANNDFYIGATDEWIKLVNETSLETKQDALSDTDGGYGQRIKAIEDALAAAIDFDTQTY